jgi:hypothetical protein
MIKVEASLLLNGRQVVNRRTTTREMDPSEVTRPQCPRCGGTNLRVCGESVEFRPAERPSQRLSQGAIRTIAYKCECGLGFTETDQRDSGTDESP